jgi:tetratricopeptide (TPR) repeat protein
MASLSFLLFVTGDVARAQSSDEKKALTTATNNGMSLLGQGKLVEARPYLEKAFDLSQRVYGRDHRNTGVCSINLGMLRTKLGEYAEAEHLLQRGVEILEAKLGKDHLEVASSLGHLASLYASINKHAKAEPLLHRSLRIREAKLGKDDPAVANALSSLAQVYVLLGEYEKAEVLHLRSLQINELKLGKDHVLVADDLDHLGQLSGFLGRYDRMESFFQRSLGIREAKLGKDHLDVARSLHSLANAYSLADRYDKALPLLRRGLTIQETKLGNDHPDLTHTLDGLANVHKAQGQFDEAERCLKRSLTIRETKLPRHDPEIAAALQRLANVYAVTERYEKAETLALRGLDIYEISLGKDHPRVAASLNVLARNYEQMGQFAKALTLYRRSLQIYEARLGKDHPDVATSLAGMARLHTIQNQYVEAELLFKRCLTITEAAHGTNSVAVAELLNQLGGVYVYAGQYDKAESSFQRSLRICEATMGKNHLAVAKVLEGLAVMHWYRGQHDKAEPLFRRSSEIQEAYWGKDHPSLVTPLSNLVVLNATLQRGDEALRFADRQRRIVRRQMAKVLPYLAEIAQLEFLEHRDRVGFSICQSLALLKGGSAAVAVQSAGWVVNQKGLAQQALSERALLARDTTNPATRGLAQELTGIRRHLATLTMAHFGPEQRTALRAQIAELSEKEQDLSARLGHATDRLGRDEPWIELESVRKALPADAVLVEISRRNVADFQFKDPQRQWLSPRYAAWLIPPTGKGDVRLVDLGETSPIEDAICALRRGLQESPPSIQRKGESDSEGVLCKGLSKLSKLVLEPLLPQISSARQWIISPDAELWLVPWAALPLENGRYAIEDHSIRYVISGRDLVAGATKAAVDRPLILADPDYDATPSDVAHKARKLGGVGSVPGISLVGQRLRGSIGTWSVSFAFGKEGRLTIYDEDGGSKVAGEGSWLLDGTRLTMKTARSRYAGSLTGEVVRGERTTSDATDTWQIRIPSNLVEPAEVTELRASGASSLLPSTFQRLPGTAAEAAAVGPIIKSFASAEPKMYLGREATEDVFKTVRSPRLVVLSTHGFFLPSQHVQEYAPVSRGVRGLSEGDKAVLTTDGKPLENPLLRCGLLLAGCNHRNKTSSGTGDDGVLTGLEIVGTDLRGTELVVLSACETGLGDIRNGEGVAGLRQAFQLAGAQSVVATLWQIPDRESALLMSEFFAQLAKGRSKTDALREAQLARITARRARHGAAHPFFWAAYTFTGQDRPR